MNTIDIPAYLAFLPASLLAELAESAEPVPAIPGLQVQTGLRTDFPEIETDEALAFVVELYRDLRQALNEVLQQRSSDRAFIDRIVASGEEVIGQRDEAERIVIGPQAHPANKVWPAVSIPDFLAGDQVTLFGPPDTARMSINAMNALHRKAPDEPEIMTRLVDAAGQVPRWGADDEDSKTPIMADFLRACENLTGCFNRTLRYDDPRSGKSYTLADDQLAIPIKRIPGLALPDSAHLLDGSPLPLHLYDFAMHLFHNYANPEALVFYIPKLENEEEAAYLKSLITSAETAIQALHPAYEPGTIKLFIVFENPRAIFRIREIAETLFPHFVGGSLGWHDFLASTARLLKHDASYRIPVKADPNIVINHIRESHHILAASLAPMGAIRIGGMYGVLPVHNNPASEEITLIGFIKDVVTQLKRDLTGFWVAHPDFVRPGIALVEAWRQFERQADRSPLELLVEALIPDSAEQAALLDFVFADDIPGLPADDPQYLRGVLAANLKMSDVIANDDPEEVRYNVFQALQYLADWLCGNGCVALPASLTNRQGESIPVRIMDDLATTERSRWELWAEVAHGRVSVELFDTILAEELAFILSGAVHPTRQVQVAAVGEAASWYPVAAKILRDLVVTDTPPEFATEPLLPYTTAPVRNAADPYAAASAQG